MAIIVFHRQDRKMLQLVANLISKLINL